MVGLGFLHPFSVLAAVVIASLLADLVWYLLGRRHGGRILKILYCT